MSPAAAQRQDGMRLWCGYVLMGVAFLIPFAGWLGPLAFAPLLGLMGLLCLPAFTLRPGDRLLFATLAVAVVWATASLMWSPFAPEETEEATALKLAAQLPLYWAAVSGARRAHPLLRILALRLLFWGLVVFGAIMLAEAATGGAIYGAVRQALGDPIRPDLGRKNLANASFVLALLWPVASAAGWRAGAPAWPAPVMAAGAAAVALVFLSDAPVLAVGASVLIMGLVLALPRTAPRALAAGAVVMLLATPWALLALERQAGAWAQNMPDSWSQRIGYWRHAVDLILAHPLRGWGLDASRTFAPAINLHPHNGALQLWLELGAVGALAVALAAGLMLSRLARPRRDLLAAGVAGSAAAYLLFGALNFGVWQEWWLALGALVAVIAAAAVDLERRPG